ncbi:unannotated protein [freshwater metagenome]|uniref:Unannotated protein n=1 Tax=freshwater metagenome TaxID=449393 RepID=A0A6J6F036_9ZZZZ
MCVTDLQGRLKSGQFMEYLLEPQLIDLVNGNEEQLVVLGAIREWLLQGQQFRNFQIARIGHGLLV